MTKNDRKNAGYRKDARTTKEYCRDIRGAEPVKVDISERLQWSLRGRDVGLPTALDQGRDGNELEHDTQPYHPAVYE